jgi:hypothetical protein
MGGLLIIFSIIVTTLLWGVMNRMLIIFLCVLCSLCVLGFMDDFIKIRYKRDIRDGISGKAKMLVQFLIALLAAYFLYKTPEAVTMQIFVPFFKDPMIALPDMDAEKIYLMTPFSKNPLFSQVPSGQWELTKRILPPLISRVTSGLVGRVKIASSLSLRLIFLTCLPSTVTVATRVSDPDLRGMVNKRKIVKSVKKITKTSGAFINFCSLLSFKRHSSKLYFSLNNYTILRLFFQLEFVI